MTDAEKAHLGRECALLTRHLAGSAPSDYVVSRYIAAHELGRIGTERDTALDALLVRLANRGGVRAAMSDVYARLFRPGGRLRRKLVLLAAILESSVPAYHMFESPPRSSAARVLGRLALSGVRFTLLLLAALAFVGPVHVFLKGTRRASVEDPSTVVAPT